MKKLFLLLTAGVVALSATAQQRLNNSVALGMAEQKLKALPTGKSTDIHGLLNTHTGTANKTTTAGALSRWYNYTQYLDSNSGGGGTNINISSLYLWNDTTSTDIYSGPTLAFNTMVSIASIFDPYFSGFNDVSLYDSTKVTGYNGTFLSHYPTKSYIIDSITVFGVYGINPSKISVVDTITIGYTYGSGVPTTNTEDIWKNEFDASFAASLLTAYGLAATDTMWFNELYYDSTKNTGGGMHFNKQIFTISKSGTTSNTSASWGDTLSDGTFAKSIALTTPMTVPGGDFAGFTITFKSGDASHTFGDTVFTGNAGAYYRYNMFRPFLGSNAPGGTTSFPIYNVNDHNEGLYKTLPNYENGWDKIYVPQWAWTAGGGASDLQYPYMDVHVKCPTCVPGSGGPSGVQAVASTTPVIKAYPNPATNELAISFTNASGKVSVSLTNMVGQVVATQNMGTVSAGEATFNTTALASGMYIYTVEINGTRTTGHVAVKH